MNGFNKTSKITYFNGNDDHFNSHTIIWMILVWIWNSFKFWRTSENKKTAYFSRRYAYYYYLFDGTFPFEFRMKSKNFWNQMTNKQQTIKFRDLCDNTVIDFMNSLVLISLNDIILYANSAIMEEFSLIFN